MKTLAEHYIKIGREQVKTELSKRLITKGVYYRTIANAMDISIDQLRQYLLTQDETVHEEER